MSLAPAKHFVFVFCDQLRGDALGSLGALPPLRTPAMDALAAGGARFASCYTPNPVCVPAREAVITGRWGHRFGCMENGDPRPDAGLPTFPRLLHAAGYATFSAGKQHFSPAREHRGYGRLELSEGQPAYRQDDEYLMYLQERGYGHVTEPGGRRGRDYYLPQECPLPDELHMTPWTAARCAAFIRANHNRSFFCAAAFFKPHPPFDPPRSYWDRYPSPAVELPRADDHGGPPLDDFLRAQNRSKNMDAPDEDRVRAVRAAYYALVEQIDDGIALLVGTLRDCGILEDTVIVISADHGELLGDHGGWGKRSFYEGSARVPLIVSWPAGGIGGRVLNAPVSTLDLFPTLLDAAGLPAPADVDGASLLDYARGGAPPRRGGVAAEYGKGRKLKLMWRWQEGERSFKYIWIANGGREQLFDLTADPHERRNLAGDDPSRRRTARERLVAWCRETDFPAALSADGGLAALPFAPIPLGEVNRQRPAWPDRDPAFSAG